MPFLTSADGTKLSYLKQGTGPALVLVDGALCYTESGFTPQALPVLARHFTVYAYDRRGRGQSGNTLPWSLQKEIDDLAAVVAATGTRPIVCGFSAGAALALYAAASGLQAKKYFFYDAPFTVVDATDAKPPVDAVNRLEQMITRGDNKGAVKYFMKDIMGMPGFVIAIMNLVMHKNMKQAWAIAPTLPYDISILDMTQFGLPTEQAGKITVPATVMYGEKTAAKLVKSAKALAALIPHADLLAVPKATHMVKPDMLANVLMQQTTS